MLRIAVVEDEEKWVEKIKKYIARFASENQIEEETLFFKNGKEITDDFHANYDVIFFDVEMPEMDGMTAAARIREKDREVPIIFVTRVAQYAVRGYEVGALDFIVKPFRYEVFAVKMNRILRQVERSEEKNVTLNINEDIYRISAAKILYVEVAKHYLFYHTDEGILRTRGSLNAAEEQLSGLGFARCNSCYLVNLRHVKAIRDGMVWIGSDSLQISRAKKKGFTNAVAEFIGGI